MEGNKEEVAQNKPVNEEPAEEVKAKNSEGENVEAKQEETSEATPEGISLATPEGISLAAPDDDKPSEEAQFSEVKEEDAEKAPSTENDQGKSGEFAQAADAIKEKLAKIFEGNIGDDDISVDLDKITMDDIRKCYEGQRFVDGDYNITPELAGQVLLLTYLLKTRVLEWTEFVTLLNRQFSLTYGRMINSKEFDSVLLNPRVVLLDYIHEKNAKKVFDQGLYKFLELDKEMHGRIKYSDGKTAKDVLAEEDKSGESGESGESGAKVDQDDASQNSN